MQIIECEVQRSSLYKVYIGYDIVQDAVNCTTTVNHGLYIEQLTNGYDFNGNMNIAYWVNNTKHSTNRTINMDDKGDAGYTIAIISGKSATITHDATTGVGSFTVQCEGVCDSGGNGPGTISLPTRTVSLPTIDRTPPNVSISISNVKSDSLTLTATTDTPVDFWQYTLDDGQSWYELSTTVGTSVVKSIGNLLPSFEYKVKVRAKKQSNQVVGESSVHAIKSQGGSVLNSVGYLGVDVENPTVTLNVTVYEQYTHTLVIKDYLTTIVEIPNIRCNIGTSSKTIQLTDAQRTTILEYMWDKQTLAVSYELVSYDGSTQIGDASKAKAIISTFAEVSAPEFLGGVTFTELNENVATLTGTTSLSRKKIFLKNISMLSVNLGACSAKNEAEISEVEVTVGSKIQSYDYTGADSYGFGTIFVSGDNVTVRVTLIDSRGYRTSADYYIQVDEYKAVSIEEYSVRRKNEVESTVLISYSGKFSSITNIRGNEANKIQKAYIRYNPAGLPVAAAEIIVPVTTSGNSFEFSTEALSDSGTEIFFDPESQYDIELWVEDGLSTDHESIRLNRGTPLVAFRAKKIGINEAKPTAVLDIKADPGVEPLKLNGKTLFDFIYPIGSIYITANSTNPSVLFGGYWIQIKDKFLLACGDTYAAGSTGGEATHTLTIAEMPSHAHNDGTAADRGINAEDGGVSAVVYWENSQGTRTTTYVGGGEAHNNMPPYMAVYVWMRMIPPITG